MKRKINVKLLLFFIVLLIVAAALLGMLVHMEQGSDFQARLYGHHTFFDNGMKMKGPEGFVGIMAFSMIAAACYGIFKVFQGAGTSDLTSGLQMPSASCILLSAVLIGIGGVFAYLEWFRGYEFGRRYNGLTGIIFLLLGGMVFYRGMQGKEFRFWSKNWQSLDEEAMEKKLEKSFLCPYCGAKMMKKEENCPVCGRKL